MLTESSETIIKKISSMINGATESLIVLTGKLNEDLVNEVSRKSASGVKTTVITSDTNWSRYLENLSKIYGKDIEEKLRKSIENLNFKSRLYSRLRYIVLATSLLIFLILFVLLGLNTLLIVTTLLLVGLNIAVFITLHNMTKSIGNELAIRNENLRRESEELKSVRERLGKNLQVIETVEVSFTLIISDEKALITSYIPNYSKNSLHYVQEMNKDEALKIVSLILNLGKP